mgnify:CR=1 FL=1
MSNSLVLRSRSVVLVTVVLGAFAAEAGERPLTFEDLMKFRQIRAATISEDGEWVAYALVPDRGDGEAVARSTTSEREFRVERGSGPVFSADGRWVAASITPSLEEREKAEAKGKKKGSAKNDDEKPKT